MQDDSQLVDGNEKLTQQLKTFLGQQAMHIEVNTLAEIFAISPHTVKNVLTKYWRSMMKSVIGIISLRSVCTLSH